MDLVVTAHLTLTVFKLYIILNLHLLIASKGLMEQNSFSCDTNKVFVINQPPHACISEMKQQNLTNLDVKTCRLVMLR